MVMNIYENNSMKYERNFYEIKSNDEIFEQLNKEQKSIGYYKLPFQDVEEIINYSKTIKQTNIFIVGIGGSSLGTKAIHKFLNTRRRFEKRLFFLDTSDPLEINFLLSNIDIDDSHFIIISKSGNTIETISIFKYLYHKVNISNKTCTVITENNNPLYDFSTQKNIKTFEIKKNVGGRFSVFSPVGLLPLAIIGVDILKLLDGCKTVHNSFFEKSYYYDHIINKARFLVENKSRFVNNIIFSYSTVFSEFNKWYVQLWAESLGKININGTRQGLTPIALLGPDDQHSFLQLIIDGVRNKTVTILKIDNLMDNSKIPANSDLSILNADFLDNKSFNELINFQADATYESIINERDIPCDIITISSVDEECIAKLMYRFQLIVSCIGCFLQINTYDQPGVESGKSLLIKKLSCND